MGRLSGFNYRRITKILKRFHFTFDRQAAGSHEIWFNEEKTGTRPFPAILGIFRKAH